LRQAVVSLVWALGFAARGPSAEWRGFLSTSLPSAHPPHRAKIGLTGAPDALGSIILALRGVFPLVRKHSERN
jgi:hypothetical protein